MLVPRSRKVETDLVTLPDGPAAGALPLEPPSTAAVAALSAPKRVRPSQSQAAIQARLDAAQKSTFEELVDPQGPLATTLRDLEAKHAAIDQALTTQTHSNKRMHSEPMVDASQDERLALEEPQDDVGSPLCSPSKRARFPASTTDSQRRNFSIVLGLVQIAIPQQASVGLGCPGLVQNLEFDDDTQQFQVSWTSDAGVLSSASVSTHLQSAHIGATRAHVRISVSIDTHCVIVLLLFSFSVFFFFFCALCVPVQTCRRTHG